MRRYQSESAQIAAEYSAEAARLAETVQAERLHGSWAAMIMAARDCAAEILSIRSEAEAFRVLYAGGLTLSETSRAICAAQDYLESA